jgi:hypothetical protein
VGALAPALFPLELVVEFGCQSLVVRRDWNFVGNAAGCVSKVPVRAQDFSGALHPLPFSRLALRNPLGRGISNAGQIRRPGEG